MYRMRILFSPTIVNWYTMLRTYRPKIRVWDSSTQSTVHVFVGVTPSPVQTILKALEKKNVPTKEQEVLLQNHFGKDYSKVLAMEDPSPVKFHYETFYKDDTVNMFRKKLCYYLGLSSPNEMYIWYERDVSRDVAILYDFVQHIFKKESRVPYAQFRNATQDYFQLSLDADAFNMLERHEALKILIAANIKTVKESLCFRYLYNKYVEYVAWDPFYTQHKKDILTYSIQNTLSLLLQNFEPLEDTFHVVMNSPKLQSYLFPFGNANPLQPTDKSFIETVQKQENEILQTDIPDSLQQKTFVNYLHIKGNDVNINRKINVDLFFKQIKASAECPFIKVRLPVNVFYKVHTESLKTLSKEDIDKWTILNNTKDDRSYVTMKLAFYGRSYCTLTVYNDMSYHVKFNFSVKDKEDPKSIETFLQNTVNKYLSMFAECYPHTFLQTIPKNILYTSKEHDNVRVTQVIMTTNSSWAKEIKYVDFANTIRQQLFTYFNIIENADPNVLHLQYKKVNNYTKMNNMSSVIYQNLALPYEEQVQQLMFSFMISKEDAEKEIESWKIKHSVELKEEQEKIYAKMKHDAFVNVKIRMNNPFELRYLINGLTDLEMFEKIQYLIGTLLVLSSKKKKTKEDAKEAAELVELMTEKENQELHEKNVKFDEIDDQIVDLLDENDDDFGLDDFGLDDELFALEKQFAMNTGTKAAELVEPKSISKNNKNAVATPDPSDETSQGRNILDKLYEADRELFDYKMDDSLYSSTCGWVDRRQPVVVNKEELDKIQKEHPGAIQGYVKSGSTAELEEKNYYICPTVWCPKSRVALSVEEFEKAGNKCPMEGEKNIDLSAKYWQGLKDPRYPGFLNKFKHPKQLCVPCCFKRINKKRIAECTKEEKAKEAVVEDNDELMGNEKYIKGENYFPLENNRLGMLPSVLVSYFGFTHHGNRHDGTGLMTEKTQCLLRRGIRQSEQSFLECLVHILDNPTIKSVNDLLKQAVEVSLQNMATFLALENGRIMKMFINPNKSVHHLADFEEFKNWFLQQKEYIQKMSIGEVANELKDMHSYDSTRMFASDILREFMLYQSLQNYKEYLLNNDVPKRHELVIDLFMNYAQHHVNTQRLNVIVIDINPVSGKASIDCYVNKHASSIVDNKKPYVFILKKGTYYEPIYYVTNSNNQLTMTCQHMYSKTTLETKKMIDFYLLNCSNPDSKLSNEKLLLHLSNEGYKPKYIVIDYGYKACGVILHANIYVPFVDRENIFFAKHVQYKYLHEVPNFKCMKKEDDIRKVYESIRKFTKHSFYDIHHMVVRNEKIIGMYIDNGKVFVPIRLDSKTKESMYFRHGLFLLLGEEKDDIRTKMLESLYQDHDHLVMLRDAIAEHIDKNEDLRREIEFLQDPSNPFPDTYKRKKILQLLQPIVESNHTWDDKKLNQISDLILGKTKTLSNYIQQRIRRYAISEAEVLMDHSDIKRGKLLDLKAQVENPYQYLLTQVHQLSDAYIFEQEHNDDFSLTPVFAEKSTYKDLPVKFRKMLKGFSILDADESYHPGYILNAFLNASSILSSKNAISEDMYKAALQREIVRVYNIDGGPQEILENPWLQDYLVKQHGKMEPFPLEYILQGIDHMNYYPSILDIKLMARLSRVNLVISGRKTKKNPDAIEIIDHGSNYYMILLYSYDRFKVLNKFELFVMDHQFLFDKKDLGLEFATMIDKKKHVYEVNVDDNV